MKKIKIGDKEFVNDNGNFIEKKNYDNYKKKLSTHRKIGGMLSEVKTPGTFSPHQQKD